MTLHIEYLPLADLTANPRNSRTHDPDQILMIADSTAAILKLMEISK